MYIYYETDGDSGYYNIKLFTSRLEAEKYHKKIGSGYGNVTEVEVDDEVENVTTKQSLIEETLCPECGEKMISRKGAYGVFWGCSKYPKCKGTRDSQGRSKAERNAENENTDQARENDKYRFNRG